jgi:hypothetical protein
MTDNTQKLTELLELANNYPSPHNGQPMIMSIGSGDMLNIYFDTSRGLTATPISFLFSFVTVGVFIRHFELCAQALGHHIEVKLQLPKTSAMADAGKLLCATAAIRFDAGNSDDALKNTIKQRQTSRKKYTNGLTNAERQRVDKIATDYQVANRFVTDRQAHQIVWLNQRAVFDDMFDPAIRAELDHWLRYSEEEKHQKKDGLAYDCMELSGAALKAAVKYYKILHWPIVAPLLKRYYLRTMKDSSTVGYLMSPFTTEIQAYNMGRCIIEMWLELARVGKYLHPFGTIISNSQAHHDFADLINLRESRTDNYVVFIYRAGASPKPVESDRIPINEHLLSKEQI